MRGRLSDIVGKRGREDVRDLQVLRGGPGATDPFEGEEHRGRVLRGAGRDRDARRFPIVVPGNGGGARVWKRSELRVRVQEQREDEGEHQVVAELVSAQYFVQLQIHGQIVGEDLRSYEDNQKRAGSGVRATETELQPELLLRERDRGLQWDRGEVNQRIRN